VLTLQLANENDSIPIPANRDNYRVAVHGTLPNDAVLLGFFPHMHLRGKKFEYNIVSPDGRRVAFIGLRRDGSQSLWVRDLSLPAARELADTSGAAYPFWSPDSRRIAYFARGRLYTMEASGGTVRTVCDAAYPRGGTWSPGDVILFAQQWQALHRVSAAGGASVAVTELGKDVSHRFPHFLPDGRHFLYIGFTFARKAGNKSPGRC
jgi:Tol biopolymer transport system component